MDGTVPSNKELVDKTVLFNKELVDETVPSNSTILINESQTCHEASGGISEGNFVEIPYFFRFCNNNFYG